MKLVLLIPFLSFLITFETVHGAKGADRSNSRGGINVPVDKDDMIRKSIIYDKKTPDVFYCPLGKHDGLDEMIVKARPLSKLCEFNGKERPKGSTSDCYQDVDESDYACKEKKRIMKKKEPPGMEVLEKYQPMTREKRAQMYELHHQFTEKLKKEIQKVRP